MLWCCLVLADFVVHMLFVCCCVVVRVASLFYVSLWCLRLCRCVCAFEWGTPPGFVCGFVVVLFAVLLCCSFVCLLLFVFAVYMYCVRLSLMFVFVMLCSLGGDSVCVKCAYVF